MQNFRNYYEILGVNRDTSGAEIKRAYRQLARRYHPDVNQGDIEAENRFKEINEAYEVLSDVERRAQYDKYGSFWKQQGFQNGQKRPWDWPGGKTEAAPQPAAPDLDFGQFRDFNSFVDELMRRRTAAPAVSTEWLDNNPAPRRRPPVEPTRMSSAPPIADQVDTSSEANDWDRPAAKPRSDDWGGAEPVRPGSRNATTAADADRRQQFTARPRPPESRDQPSQAAGFGRDDRAPDSAYPPPDARYQPDSRPLPRDVEATLTVPLEKAYTGGRERIRLEDGRMLEVNLPQAIIGGQKVRLKGQGIAGGDLYLRIDVAPHKFYKLNGLDLMTQVPVTPAEAILAGAIEVPTIDGLVKMNLPRGVKSGQKLRLAQRGYPSPEGDRRGDQIVELVIQIPQDLSESEKELYDKLTQVETNPRSNLV